MRDAFLKMPYAHLTHPERCWRDVSVHGGHKFRVYFLLDHTSDPLPDLVDLCGLLGLIWTMTRPKLLESIRALLKHKSQRTQNSVFWRPHADRRGVYVRLDDALDLARTLVKRRAAHVTLTQEIDAFEASPVWRAVEAAPVAMHRDYYYDAIARNVAELRNLVYEIETQRIDIFKGRTQDANMEDTVEFMRKRLCRRAE